MKLAPGDRIGEYVLIERIGEGGTAAVYKAYREADDSKAVCDEGFVSDLLELAAEKRRQVRPDDSAQSFVSVPGPTADMA